MEIRERKYDLENDLRKIFKCYYDSSEELARRNEEGRVFTDHKSAHVNMVLNKTKDVIKAIQQYTQLGMIESKTKTDKIPFSVNIKSNVVTAIALSHDTGMSGSGYAFEMDTDGNYRKNKNGYYKMQIIDCNNYSQVRVNHGLNSAINVLKNRSNLKKLGYSDVEIDEIGAICMAHFISTSGLKDLNSKVDWLECFDRIVSAIHAYNNDHCDSKISFNRNILENDDYLSVLATEALAIRLGDVSRDSGPKAEAQSGEIVYVDRKSLNDKGGSVELEIENAVITIGDNNEPITFLKSRQVHVGEQNIIHNDTFVSQNGVLTHKITVEDGNSAPKCTQVAIHDHLRVLASAPKENFVVQIVFNVDCAIYAKLSYEKFRIECTNEYPNINVIYSWDANNNTKWRKDNV